MCINGDRRLACESEESEVDLLGAKTEINTIEGKHGRERWGWERKEYLCNFQEKAKTKINTYVRKDPKEGKVQRLGCSEKALLKSSFGPFARHKAPGRHIPSCSCVDGPLCLTPNLKGGGGDVTPVGFPWQGHLSGE